MGNLFAPLPSRPSTLLQFTKLAAGLRRDSLTLPFWGILMSYYITAEYP